MDQPEEKNRRYYKPLEKPRMYPLELTNKLHIRLWDKAGEYKWTIAYWIKNCEGYNLHFLGDKPLDKRVDWRNLEVIIRQGQLLADDKFNKEEELC